MDTHIPEDAVPLEQLIEQARTTKKRVKFYILARRTGEILIRYVTPKGNPTNGKGKRYNGFSRTAYRFTNYWHAYAYKLKRDKENGSD